MTSYLISYNHQQFECSANELLIDAALRQGVKFKFSCRKGTCHTCILQCVKGNLSKQAQQGLSVDEINEKCFLPCCCYPISNMDVDKTIKKNEKSNDKKTRVFNNDKIVDQPDMEMWTALDEGKKLKIILDDFYHQVYQDDKLSPFFVNSTEKHSSEKQYSFMRQKFSGEKCFFGDRPKNAHHWMVISDALFDYRENLLIKCLHKYGLAEHLIQRWVALDESFRSDIVKDTPQEKIINGVAYPLDGFEVLKIDEGTLCDGCNQAIEKNEIVRYHLRLGLTYCTKCMNLEKNKVGSVL